MPSKTKRLYWDSCVFLSYVNDHPERVETVDALLARSANSDGISIYTSTLAIAEVAFASLADDQLSKLPEATALIDELWSDRYSVQLIEFHEQIAREARDLQRLSIERNCKLKPYDAVHLATAQWFGVDELNTYDGHLLRFAEHIDLPIVHPFNAQPRLIPDRDL